MQKVRQPQSEYVRQVGVSNISSDEYAVCHFGASLSENGGTVGRKIPRDCYHLMSGSSLSDPYGSHLNGVSSAICTTCNKAFSCSSSLRTHVRDVHSNLGPFYCPHCNVASKSQSGLKMHIQRHHR